jgi:hypothetical protein
MSSVWGVGPQPAWSASRRTTSGLPGVLCREALVLPSRSPQRGDSCLPELVAHRVVEAGPGRDPPGVAQPTWPSRAARGTGRGVESPRRRSTGQVRNRAGLAGPPVVARFDIPDEPKRTTDDRRLRSWLDSAPRSCSFAPPSSRPPRWNRSTSRPREAADCAGGCECPRRPGLFRRHDRSSPRPGGSSSRRPGLHLRRGRELCVTHPPRQPPEPSGTRPSWRAPRAPRATSAEGPALRR